MAAFLNKRKEIQKEQVLPNPQIISSLVIFIKCRQIWARVFVSPFILIYAQFLGNLHFWVSVLSLGFCLCSTPKEKYSNLALVFSSFKVRILNTQVFHPWGLSWSLDQLFLKQPPRHLIRAGFRLELFGLFFPLWTFSFLWPFWVFASKPFILWWDPKIRTISRVMHPSERSRCPNATPSLITHTSINWMLPSHRNSTFLKSCKIYEQFKEFNDSFRNEELIHLKLWS